MSKAERGTKVESEDAGGAPVANGAEGEARPEFIVGIGASAGGLEALQQVFEAMPAHTGMAFVVVVHLKSDQKALTAGLLDRHTKLPVKEAEDGERARRDHVYVIPPGHELQIFDGHLQLIACREGALLRTPIDTFFHSLALDQQERAICIILSGMGSDGSVGLREIKSHLGMVIVQEPDTAKSTGMPDRAIQTGFADLVVAPGSMPAELLGYADAWRHGQQVAEEPAPDVKRQAVQKVLMLMRNETGHDFSGYKISTVLRRVDRRRKLHRIEDLDGYVAFLHGNRHELRSLFKEMLIGVTSFFRDAEAFDALQELLCAAFHDRQPKEFRVWVLGCSTGEEAYSVAMLARECIDEVNAPVNVQVFATDLDPDAIERARQGRYPVGIARDLSSERLDRFFIRGDNEYVVKPKIRDLVVFAEQNAIKDPPFTKLDLICCRNVLIYLESELQNKLLPLFHYSLREGGHLFIGTAESVGQFQPLFTAVNKKWKIFRRRPGESPLPNIKFPMPGAGVRPARRPRQEPGERGPNMADQTRKALLEAYAPAAAVISPDGVPYYFHGRTGKYLEPPTGQANWNILEMARKGLRLDLATAIRQASSSHAEVRRERVRVQTNGDFQCVNLRVIPLDPSSKSSDALLVAFEDIPDDEPSALAGTAGEGGEDASDERVRRLENELKRTKENLQTTVEELESSNEELKSMNEEYQSTNEELQSTNEELESSREELQSLNEELVTVNAELQKKVDDTDRAYVEMKNFLDALEIPTLFLDRDMRVQRFSAQADRIVCLIDTDVGRPITDLSFLLKGGPEAGMVDMARRVLRSLQEERMEVQTRDERWFQMRIMPYRSPDEVIEGVVVVFLDIHEQKTAQRELGEARDDQVHIGAIVGVVHEAVVVLDTDLVVRWASPRFYETFGLRPDDTIAKPIDELGGGWGDSALRKLLEETLPANEHCEGLAWEHTNPDAGPRAFSLNAQRITRDSTRGLILLALEEVTGKGR